MTQKTGVKENLHRKVLDSKNFDEKNFKALTSNFYILKAALRYYKVKKGTSFKSSQLSEDFPISVPIAGSALNVLKKLEVIESRTDSNSPDRFMPKKVDLDRMEEIEEILKENYEIEGFNPDS